MTIVEQVTPAEGATCALQEKADVATHLPQMAQPKIVLRCKWRHQLLPIPFTTEEYQTATIADLKQIIQETVDIPVDRQKFLNIEKKDGPVSDSWLLKDCAFRVSGAADVFLVGTPAAEQLPAEVEASRLYSEFNREAAIKLLPKILQIEGNQTSLLSAIATTSITLIRNPRPNKKLLVLDIDYTIYDCKGASHGYPIEVLKRPYLHQFLELINPYYDLVIWSQTRWQWLEAKCTELGLLTHPLIGPCFTLDKTSMVAIKPPAEIKLPLHRKNRKEFEVKALEVIWSKRINGWTSSNTLIVDDLARNFMLNPSNGVLVRPYTRDLHGTDHELWLLAHHLIKVAGCEDVRDVDHSQWRTVTQQTLRKATAKIAEPD
eukprot:Protomagalhaensia_wolfi_Nauph_80__2581@NODE_272_length_2967_cov_129_396175_g203_i0_p2_GENE_NODE_272_length_2967_cov_129_396175_g203_i0NODE_272_length_2967_cov_129_396175_g203_i0_p2_ORF_typecomplete_len375_score51_44NIF/PF03031_18/8_1e24ubiquitin/PF00240_23/0_00075Blt1/PF12754_7/0_0029Blt1/PF12754_7/2_1e03UN_NPL4/PF11543_8/0_16UN_NPL4/PF11543_8/4_2e03UN_NPL4/PF11543_8/1_1e04DUF4941/PF16299_5/2_1e03DUF4941/PF16299_5/0_3_NODE_272_length_2967_cov_129_396175_g203_i04451569